MPKLLSWVRKFQEKYHNPPILNHPNKLIQYSCCITNGAMGAMNLLFSQIVQENDVVLLEEFVYGGSLCCVCIRVVSLSSYDSSCQTEMNIKYCCPSRSS